MRLPVPRALAVGVTVLAVLPGCSENNDPNVPEPSSTAPLTTARARSALITTSDLGNPWEQKSSPTRSDDGVLRGTTDDAECQQLLTGLRTGNVLDETPLTRADAFFRAGESELDYRVGAYDPSAAEDGLALLKRLPDDCDQFTATLSGGTEAVVQVVKLTLPELGEEHAGLTVTILTTLDGLPATYATDVAAVRMGPNVASLSNGGLDGADHPVTEEAIESGAQRLAQVLSGQTPEPLPSLIE